MNRSLAESPEQALSPMATRHLSVAGLLGLFRIHWAGLFHLEIWTSQVPEKPGASCPGEPRSAPVRDDGILALPLASVLPTDCQPLAELLLRASVSL